MKRSAHMPFLCFPDALVGVRTSFGASDLGFISHPGTTSPSDLATGQDLPLPKKTIIFFFLLLSVSLDLSPTKIFWRNFLTRHTRA